MFKVSNANGVQPLDSLMVRRDAFLQGGLWLCGRDAYYGALGDNSLVNKSSPVQTIAKGNNCKQVAIGSRNHAAAIKTDGTLWLWGYNNFGQLGDNTIVSKSSPVQT